MNRICLVGAGYISQVHGEALAVTPGCRITAIVDPNHAAAAARAKSLRVDSVFASVDEALQAGAFDRAHVLVPPDLHAAATRPLLEAGKPVLLEKPLAVSRSVRRTAGRRRRIRHTARGEPEFRPSPGFRAAAPAGGCTDARPPELRRLPLQCPAAADGGAAVRPLDVPRARQHPAGTGGASAVADRRAGRGNRRRACDRRPGHRDRARRAVPCHRPPRWPASRCPRSFASRSDSRSRSGRFASFATTA